MIVVCDMVVLRAESEVGHWVAKKLSAVHMVESCDRKPSIDGETWSRRWLIKDENIAKMENALRSCEGLASPSCFLSWHLCTIPKRELE